MCTRVPAVGVGVVGMHQQGLWVWVLNRAKENELKKITIYPSRIAALVLTHWELTARGISAVCAGPPTVQRPARRAREAQTSRSAGKGAGWPTRALARAGALRAPSASRGTYEPPRGHGQTYDSTTTYRRGRAKLHQTGISAQANLVTP